MESVICVSPKDNFSLELWFDHGAHQLFDARPYLDHGVFSRLKDPVKFRQVFVALDAVCWPGGIDIAPETPEQVKIVVA